MSLPLLLAQTTPSADALKDWLGVLFFLLGGAVMVKKLFFDKKPETPQPLMVKNAADSGSGRGRWWA